MLWPWDLLLGRVEGAVFVLVDLVDLELVGLISNLGDLGCPEELLGTAVLVVFRGAGGVGAAAGMVGPVGAGAMLALEELFDGECMASAKPGSHGEHAGFGNQGQPPEGSSQATS